MCNCTCHNADRQGDEQAQPGEPAISDYSRIPQDLETYLDYLIQIREAQNKAAEFLETNNKLKKLLAYAGSITSFDPMRPFVKP